MKFAKGASLLLLASVSSVSCFSVQSTRSIFGGPATVGRNVASNHLSQLKMSETAEMKDEETFE